MKRNCLARVVLIVVAGLAVPGGCTRDVADRDDAPERPQRAEKRSAGFKGDTSSKATSPGDSRSSAARRAATEYAGPSSAQSPVQVAAGSPSPAQPARPYVVPSKSPEQKSRENLQMLGQALERYLLHNEGRLPSRLSDLYQQQFVFDLQTFASPASGTKITDPKAIDEQTDYYLTTNPAADRPLLLLKEKKGLHEGKALAFYSDRQIRKEEPGFPPQLLEKPAAGQQAASLWPPEKAPAGATPNVVGIPSRYAVEALRRANIKAKVTVGEPAKRAVLQDIVYRVEPAGGTGEVTLWAYGPVPPLPKLAAQAANEPVRIESIMLELPAAGSTATRPVASGATTPAVTQPPIPAKPGVSGGAGPPPTLPGPTTPVVKQPPVAGPTGPMPKEPTTSALPDVRGMTAKAAEEVLNRANLHPLFVIGEPSPSKQREGTVYRVEPPSAGSSDVRVSIYDDMPASTQSVAKTETPTMTRPVVKEGGVPEVIGLTAQAAIAALGRANFTAKLVLGNPAPAAGRVGTVYQVVPPEPGSKEVGLWVYDEMAAAVTPGKTESPGPAPPTVKEDRLPDVLGLSAREAVAALERAKFTAKPTLGDPAPALGREQTVYRVEPPASGSREVRLWIYDDPAPPAGKP